MEFWIALAKLARRKRVIIPAFVVALMFGATAYLVTPTRYVSSTTMVLTPTQYGGTESLDPTEPTGLTNPLLNFSASLTTTSAILIEAMSTKDVAKSLGAKGSTKVIIDDGRTNPAFFGLSGPFISIVGTSTSPETARGIVIRAREMVQERLRAWQESVDAPKKTYLTLADVVAPNAPVADRSVATKLGLMALMGGFVLSMAAAYFTPRIRAVRRRSAAARQKAAPQGAHEDGADVPAREVERRPSAPHPVPPQVDNDPDSKRPSVAAGSRTT